MRIGAFVQSAMPINIAVIDGHPDPNAARLCHALAAAYAKGAHEAGHGVRRIDVAALDFPLLRTAVDFKKGIAAPDIQVAQETIRWADHVVILYPLWLGTMPALFKGFLEQAMRPGFAFDDVDNGFPKKRLGGKSARIVVTMGMPGFFYRFFYFAHGLKNLKRNILKFCGFGPIRDTIFGMVEAADNAKRAGWLRKMEVLGRKGA